MLHISAEAPSLDDGPRDGKTLNERIGSENVSPPQTERSERSRSPLAYVSAIAAPALYVGKRFLTLSADAILLTIAAPFFAVWGIYRLVSKAVGIGKSTHSGDDV